MVWLLVYRRFLEQYYDDSLSNNSCFTKQPLTSNIIHWWYIKGQLIDMMSIVLAYQKNWTGDRTKVYLSTTNNMTRSVTLLYITIFSQHPCPSKHKSSVWLTRTIEPTPLSFNRYSSYSCHEPNQCCTDIQYWRHHGPNRVWKWRHTWVVGRSKF